MLFSTNVVVVSVDVVVALVSHADFLSKINDIVLQYIHALIYEFHFCVISLTSNHPFTPNATVDKYTIQITESSVLN